MKYIILVLLIAQTTLFSQDLHYYETGGFGTGKVYGIDGDVYKVTNLKNEGEGSLRYCLEQSGSRLIIFEVGGVIDLEEQDIRIDNGFVTVAGQTAPYPGITLIKGSLRVNADDVLIQHLTIRPGDGGYTEPVDWEPDGFSITSKNVVLDHCSVSWAIDENMSVARNGNDVTFYRCIVAEGLSNSIHAKGEHSCGSLVYFDSKNVSIIGSLYAHNFRRHPRLVSGSEVLYANNVIYNYGIYASHIGPNVGAGDPNDPGICDFIGNAYFKGEDSWDDYMVESHKGDFDKNNTPANGKAYLEDNIGLDRTNGNSLIQHDGNITLLTSSSVKPETFQANPAYDNIELVLKHAGSRPKERSDVDARIIQSLINGTGSIINSQEEVGGYPDYDSTWRSIEDIPSTVANRRNWLDSISTSLDVVDDLDVSPLYSFIDEYLTSSIHVPEITSFQCYPKLVTNNITVSFFLNEPKNLQIYLVDLTGRKIYLNNNLECTAGKNEHLIKISKYSLPGGAYNLLLTDGSQSFTEKIVIKKQE